MMEGESLWYMLGAVAFTFGLYFPPMVPRKFLVAPTMGGERDSSHAHRIRISEAQKILSFSELGRFAQSHCFKSCTTLIRGQPLFGPGSSTIMDTRFHSI